MPSDSRESKDCVGGLARGHVPDENLYPQVLSLLDGRNLGKTLDIPCGEGAFACELMKKKAVDIVCLDINRADFKLSGQVDFLVSDINNRLPFKDEVFDCIFCLEGLEHLVNPFSFVLELGRVLRAGGRLFISTPNIMSVDGRLKFMLTGYFPRFRPLMYDRVRLRHDGLEGHISPIYFWQLKYFLEERGLIVKRVSTNTIVFPESVAKKWLRKFVAKAIRQTVRNRNLPDEGTLGNAMLFGDCIIVEAVKRGR